MFQLYYCKKCGRCVMYSHEGQVCDKCDSELFQIPKTYLDEDLPIFFKNKEVEQEFIETYIKSSPEFDQYYFDHREEISRQKHGEHLNIRFTDGGKTAYVEGSNQDPNVNTKLNVRCPYCSSSNVKKIGAVSRSFSARLFGLGSGKIGKQWHCNGCGSDF